MTASTLMPDDVFAGVHEVRSCQCGATVIMIPLRTGRMHAVDAAPSGGGNVELVRDDDGAVAGRVVMSDLERRSRGHAARFRLLHVVSCTAANRPRPRPRVRPYG